VLKTVTHGLVMSTHTIGRRSSARAIIARCMLSSCVRPSVHHNASTVSKRRRSRLKMFKHQRQRAEATYMPVKSVQ